MLNLFLFYFQSFSSSACLLDHMDIVVVTLSSLSTKSPLSTVQALCS